MLARSATLLALTLFAAPAFAGDPAGATPPAPAPAATAPAPDCTKLTGDAKTTCETTAALEVARAALVTLGDCAKVAAAEAKAQCVAKKTELDAKVAELQAKLAPPAEKGGKAVRSNTNRMEAEASDE